MMTFVSRMMVALFLVYFTVHAVSGEQGLVHWMQLQGEEARLHLRLSDLQGEKAALEAHLIRLRVESLDIDYLDYLARSRLAMALPGEIVLYDDDPH